MNDITKNIQLDIVSINTKIHLLQNNFKEIEESLASLRYIINANIEKEKLLSLKPCQICNGEGGIKNNDHCTCCEYQYEEPCSNCDSMGEVWR